MLKKLIAGLCLATGFFVAAQATAANRAMIVLDGSGSMWGEIQGVHKIEIARNTLREVLGTVPKDLELGLIAYGHREKGNCQDIQQIIPAGPNTAQAISAAVSEISPKGKTPLTAAVIEAARAMRYTENKATVILITDGLETCNADPCAIATSLEKNGIDFTTHVIGFGLTEEEGRQVACIAENTGGVYKQASDARDLGVALTQTVVQQVAPPPPAPVVQAEPAPQPEPTPPPAPVALDKNLKVNVFMAEGKPFVKANPRVQIFDVVSGQVVKKGHKNAYGLNTAYKLPDGEKMVRVSLGNSVKEYPVTISQTELTEVNAIMDVAYVQAQAIPAEGADPINARIRLYANGKTVSNQYNTFKMWVAAGEFDLRADIGKAVGTKKLTVVAGETYNELILAAAGILDVSSIYTEGGPEVSSNNLRTRVFSAKKNLQGKRKEFGNIYGPKARFTLAPGDYLVQTSLGKVVRTFPVKVGEGELSELVANLEAGILSVTAADGYRIDIVGAKKNIEGKQQSFGGAYGTKFVTTLTPGEYVIRWTKNADKKTVKELPAVVKAGERTDINAQ